MNATITGGSDATAQPCQVGRCATADAPKPRWGIIGAADLWRQIRGAGVAYRLSMSGGESVSAEKRMALRYAGTCHLCGADLPARGQAIYEFATKTVRCIDCSGSAAAASENEPADIAAAPLDEAADVAGGSARREYERRKDRREKRIRTSHPKLGGLILALSDEPQSTRAWAIGAAGEQQLGTRLDGVVSPTLQVLHDRRIPGTRANIDHIVVCSSGVFVIDAKKYKGRPHVKVEGGVFRPRVEKLLVGSRDCTKIVEGVLKQVSLVSAALQETHQDVPVHGALCFVGADWPLFGGSFLIRGVRALWPKRLISRIGEAGPLAPGDIRPIVQRLAGRFPVA